MVPGVTERWAGVLDRGPDLYVRAREGLSSRCSKSYLVGTNVSLWDGKSKGKVIFSLVGV